MTDIKGHIFYEVVLIVKIMRTTGIYKYILQDLNCKKN